MCYPFSLTRFRATELRYQVCRNSSQRRWTISDSFATTSEKGAAVQFRGSREELILLILLILLLLLLLLIIVVIFFEGGQDPLTLHET